MNSQVTIRQKMICSLASIMLSTLLASCVFPSMWGKPGYYVRIRTILENKQDLEPIKRHILGFDFRIHSSEEKDSDDSTVTYIKKISDHIKDDIIIMLRYEIVASEKNKLRFHMDIENVWVGGEPFIKSQIDELGDFFYTFLADRVGRENVTIDRRTIGPPF